MKKIIIILGIIMSIYLIMNNQEEIIFIPNEAIRVRVIANSNSEYDIEVKEYIKDVINNIVEKKLAKSSSITEAREIINKNINNINNFVEKELKKINYQEEFNINYGLNYFPEKIFKGIKYQEGYYESLVITLGKGLGNNYWCVLYPPLCLIDENKNNNEYHIFIKDLLDKYL